MDKNQCHAHALCKNTKGSYHCFCKKGYTGDGHSCEGKTKFSNF